jgi:alpha-tubulin suppressor-like RCC1 family protein
MFNTPSGLAIDAAGNVLVADKGNHRIRQISPAGVVSTIAGSDSGYAEGPSLGTAKFSAPSGVAIDADGNIYVADTKNYRIRLITATSPSQVVTLAGNGTRGSGDNDAQFAQFNRPVAIAVTAAGNIYVADSNSIRKIAAGQVSTLAGNDMAGFSDGNGTAARFNRVSGITIDATGNIYVADAGNNRIRAITPAGTVSNFAGNGNATLLEEIAPNASFNNPTGIVNDASGVIYVADAGNKRIREIRPYNIISSGRSHTLILKEDNSLWATGDKTDGALGNGQSSGTINIPVHIMDNVKAISTGEFHSLILKTDNSLWGTGSNSSGQLGDGTFASKSTPVFIMNNVQAMAAGAALSLILKTDNTLWACGWNGHGQLGDGTTELRSTPVKIMDNVKAIAAGYLHILILKQDNTVWAAGYDAFGELGNGGNSDDQDVKTPVKIMDNVKAIAAGHLHSLMLKQDNTLWGAGFNIEGQLGNGFETKFSPVQIMGNVRAMAAGQGHTLILKQDYTLWVSGQGAYGQLGTGNPNEQHGFVQVMTDVISLAAGYSCSLIIKPGNTAWGVGYNFDGELGVGDFQGNTAWRRMLLP